VQSQKKKKEQKKVKKEVRKCRGVAPKDFAHFCIPGPLDFVPIDSYSRL
jgi:hypothetical protein